MENLLFTISIISGIIFALSLIISIISLANDDEFEPRSMMGVIFILAVWKFSLTLAIIGIFFTVISIIIQISIHNGK